MADPSEKPLEFIHHSYWPILYSIYLYFNLLTYQFVDIYSNVLPIILLSSYG